jgi:diguanylate cyclase (GGDEF)-like protein
VTASVLESARVELVGEAASGEQALALARTAQPTVAIIDAGLSGIGPAETARRMREEADRRLEIVAVASFESIGRIGGMVAAGAAAYVVKGKPAELIAAVKSVSVGSGLLSAEASRPVLEEVSRLYDRERVRNVELERMVSRLQALSVTDSLTGLKNHGFFFDRLAEELERASRYSRPLAVIIADIDDFKQVNDAFGHAAGDAVLRSLGDVFRTQLREVDLACRIGGEEFGFLLPETDEEGGMRAAERIRSAVETFAIPEVGRVTVSLGVAVFPEHATERDELLESADTALYQAKHEGKNCSRLAGDSALTVQLTRARPTTGPVVGALLAALRMRVPYLAEHSVRVAELAPLIGAGMGLSVARLGRLRLAALLHDVGMLGVPDSILIKPGPLDEAEWDIVRDHPRNGHDLVVDAVHAEVAEAVVSHHERMDGTGYPRGLSGEDIPLLARILLAADAFDAMTMPRSYQRPLEPPEALAELRRHAGTQFDPEVVEVLAEHFETTTRTSNILEFPHRSVAG